MERLSTPPKEILPGQQGHTPWRPARCLRLRGRLTRAMTDSHRAALLTRLASGASTRHQPFAAPRSRLAIRPLAAKRSPASISISIASRVDAAGSRKRRGGLPSMGQTNAWNGSDQWLAADGQPSLRDDARESICIAWFRASHPDGAAVHSTQGNPTGATGPHAIAARPPLEPTRPIDEGDDGFTSGCAASTGRFRCLDAPLQPPRPLRAGSPSGPSPPNAAPCHLYLNGDQS